MFMLCMSDLAHWMKVQSSIHFTKRHHQSEWAEDALISTCPSWCHEGSLGSMLQRCVDMCLTSEFHLDTQMETHPNTMTPFLTSSKTQTQTQRILQLHPVSHMFIHLPIHLFVRECCIGSRLQRGPDMCVTFEINLDIQTETQTNTIDLLPQRHATCCQTSMQKWEKNCFNG